MREHASDTTETTNKKDFERKIKNSREVQKANVYLENCVDQTKYKLCAR